MVVCSYYQASNIFRFLNIFRFTILNVLGSCGRKWSKGTGNALWIMLLDIISLFSPSFSFIWALAATDIRRVKQPTTKNEFILSTNEFLLTNWPRQWSVALFKMFAWDLLIKVYLCAYHLSNLLATKIKLLFYYCFYLRNRWLCV